MGLSLQGWFQQMMVHPWHGWQLAHPQLVPVSANCSMVLYEHGWQNADRAGREDIRRSITRAEDLWLQYARYAPKTVYHEVTLPWPVVGDYRLTRFTSSDAKGHWLSSQLDEGYVQKLGYEHITTPDVVALSFADLDNDGLYETATCTATVPAGTTADELYITFTSADYVYPESDNSIPIRSATITNTTATIILNTTTLVRPILYTVASPKVLDPTILPPTANSPFASTVNVARRYCDDTGTTIDTCQAELIWETAPFPYWAIPWTFNNTTKDPAALAYAIARGGVRDVRQGLVYCGEGVYNPTTGWSGRVDFSECRPPDRVKFRYQAGINTPNLDIVIARLAAGELARPIAACDTANRYLYNWQFDVSRTGASDERFQTPRNFDNPLGTRRGHIYAWNSIQESMILQGIIAG